MTVTAPQIIGLTSAEAAARRDRDGPNEVARPRPRHLVARILDQLRDPLVLLLLAAVVVTIALGDLPDTAIIALVVVLNTTIGVVQQVRADHAIAALDTLSAPTARVVRDGHDVVVPAAQLVREDWVRLEAGDIVPADLVVAYAHRCQVDEAVLTGESMPVVREPGDELLSGTVLVTGRAEGPVRRTGADSALGRIASLARGAKAGPTPLQRRLAGLGRLLGAAIVAVSVMVAVLGVLAGRPVVTMALVAVSLVVAAVPESLPAVVTLALALGARRIARHQAIPRNLHAVETLGSVTVLASDKTGTVTEGRMAVRRAIAEDIAYEVHGAGYEPIGVVVPDPGPPLRELARAGLLCSDAALLPPDDDHPQWYAVGDPVEAALVAFAARCGLDPHQQRAAYPRVAERPFDQAARRMTTVHKRGDSYYTVCKGAPETVLTAPVVTGDVERLRRAAADLAAQGLRVVAVAAGQSEDRIDAADPRGLWPLGVIGIGDPLRAGASHTAGTFGQAGVRMMLITGDHPNTAAAIAQQLGLWHEGDGVGTGDHPEQANEVQVFARTRPEQKIDIITALQSHGEVVAMTGDGVNDAPALRRADIGVAMGGGTEVARQAADLVLVDDNLDTVTAAIGEGRRVYDNIRRFLRYGLAGGVAELLVMLAGPFLGLAVPLLPGQILWINLLTHGLPGVALGAEPAEPDVLTRPPRPPGEQVLGEGLGRTILAVGTLLAVVSAGLAVFAANAGLPWQSMLFVTLGLAQLGVALAVRARRDRAHRWANPGLLLAVGISALAQIGGVLAEPLRVLLRTEPLTGTQLLLCAAVAALPGLLLWAVNRRRGRRA
ncbi:Ca2+-transporting ATPase [Hamadaea flava]|uniref:Cation-translocating P-type ATPase n=1 Tax=Hamadaea flava TaxID=1742688 RepID=A0ABV8LZM1_9ACTN|nr:cation-transporting P-type ATPase [Hamadaea flava]MCP2329362.1 Ca2+-transporting ATPase [Hamadaea flava]